MLKGKVKLLGKGHIEGACGPVFSITHCLLDECRLIMWTDAGVWYAHNNDIHDTVENFGCGLKVVEVHEIENELTEAVIEPIPNTGQSPIYVNGLKRMPPSNAYILATDFAGEFAIALLREDKEGNRTLLWGDDFIYK